MVSVTESFEFAASHRLHCPSMSEDENRALFGKCANPNGHGHNYFLEVTLRGEPDERTGMIVRGDDLDRVVEDAVLAEIDHTYLNVDRPELFGDRVPTAENICVVVWEMMAPHLEGFTARLVRLRLEETRDCFVEYSGPVGGAAS